MITKLKVNLWDLTALIIGLLCAFAGILLIVAQVWHMPIMNFYSQVILLTFFPVLIIYIWTEKIVEWMNINSRVLDMIALTVRVISIMMFIIFAGSHIISMYKDIPYAITANYSHVMGKPVSAVNHAGTGRRSYLAVDGVRFDVGKGTVDRINRNSDLSVIYLPNSKFVIYINQKLPAPNKSKEVQEFRSIVIKSSFTELVDYKNKKVLTNY